MTDNLPTTDLDSTQPIPFRKPRRRTWMISCAVMCLFLAFLAVGFVVIVAPVVFRSLDEETQYRIVTRLPILQSWENLPTPPFASLPTVEASLDGNALALLATATQTPLASSPTATLVPPSSTPPPTHALSQNGQSALSTSASLATTAAPTATLPPTNPPPTIAPTNTPTIAVALPLSFHGTGYSWVPQTWNNCGPANLAQAMQQFNWSGNQATAAAYLKPNSDDKNVSPSEIVNYVNTQTNVKALYRVAGDLLLIRRLVSEKFPVIMETGYSLPGEGWMGHYLTVIGYDSSKGLIYGLDTMLGDGPDNLGYPEKLNDLDQRWQQFNRVYIVLYPAERESEVASILGDDYDTAKNVQHALSVAQSEISTNPNNQYAWFDMGSDYVAQGHYKDAATAFDQSVRVGGGLPYRMLWYQFGPYEAYYQTGNFKNMITLINATLQTTTDVEETYYWRGMVEAAQGKTAQAIKDFNRALQFNPNYTAATAALTSVQNGSYKPPKAS